MPVYRLYNIAMPRFVHILWITLIGLLLAACARDVNLDEEEDPYPDQIRIAFSTRQSFSSDYWYYMVFNYSGAPSTSDAVSPIDEISDENRCANWEMYIGYHKDAVAGDQLITLQRPRVPTILDSAAMPVDVASGLITDDDVQDLLVACAESDVVQLIRGIDPDPNDPLYFETAEDFDAGPQPLGVHAEDYTGDDLTDVSIVYAGRDSDPAELRILSQTTAGVFTTLNSIPITDTPVAVVAYDLNGDSGTDYQAFPSGHTSTAWAMATVIARQYRDKPMIPIISYSLATLVGVSRMAENKHWASDVLIGAILGYSIGRFVTRKKKSRFMVTPMLGKELGLQFNYVF